jgi:hypothetical protein
MVVDVWRSPVFPVSGGGAVDEVAAVAVDVVDVASVVDAAVSGGATDDDPAEVAPVAAMRESASAWVVQAMVVPAALTWGSAKQDVPPPQA